MSRRILDIHSINAIKKDDDGDILLDGIINIIGESTQVKPLSKKSEKLEKSLLPLKAYSITKMLKTLSNNFKIGDLNIPHTVESDKYSVPISPKGIIYLKSITLTATVCPLKLSSVLLDILYEINEQLSSGKSSNIIVNSNKDKVYDNLYKLCRDEIFNLLRKEGLNLV